MRLLATSLFLTLLSCCQLALPAVAVNVDPHVEEAIDAYKQQRYHAAEDLLNSYIAGHPSDQSAHLWLARTLVMLLDPKAAQIEFENTIKLNPFTAIGRQARKESMSSAGRTASDAAAPLDTVKSTTVSVNRINSEANELKSRWISDGTAAANGQMQKLSYMYGQQPNMAPNMRANRAGYGMPGMSGGSGLSITANGGGYGAPPANTGNFPFSANPGGYSTPATNSSNGTTYYSSGGGYAPGNVVSGGGSVARNMPYTVPIGTPGYGGTSNVPGLANPANINQNMPTAAFSNMSMMQQAYVRNDARIQAMQNQAETTQAATYAQESANNLERLLAEKPTAGKLKLRALGTDLYTRYYGSKENDGNVVSTPPADPIIEMKATAMRLNDTWPSTPNKVQHEHLSKLTSQIPARSTTAAQPELIAQAASLPAVPPSAPRTDASWDYHRYPVSSERELRSLNSSTPTEFTITDSTRGPIWLYWLNYRGERVRYSSLKPGQTVSQSTFATNPWVVTDQTGRPILLFVPGTKPHEHIDVSAI